MTDAFIRDAGMALDLAKHNPEALAEWARRYGGALLDHEMTQWAEAGRLRQALTAVGDLRAFASKRYLVLHGAGVGNTDEIQFTLGVLRRCEAIQDAALAAGAPEEPTK